MLFGYVFCFVVGLAIVPAIYVCGFASTKVRGFLGLSHKGKSAKTVSQICELIIFILLFLSFLAFAGWLMKVLPSIDLISKEFRGTLMSAGLITSLLGAVLAKRKGKF